MQFLLSHCQVAFVEHPSVMLTLFLAGLVGGLTHCTGMCGPFVMAQVRGEPKGSTHFRRLSGGALLPYHAGRMTTYVVLGIFAALLSKQIMGTPLHQAVSVVFLTGAGLMFLVSALPNKQALSLRVPGVATFGALLGVVARPLLQSPRTSARYGLGLLLGLLPCSLIFAALMVVSTTGNPATAAIAMMLFALGTMPSLIAVGIGSQYAQAKWPVATKNIARGVMGMNGVSLCVLAGKMIV